MSIPDYQTIMLPLLKYAEDGKEHTSRDPVASLTTHFGLSDAEQQDLLPSGGTVFADRVSWALSYLCMAGLLQRTRRGYFSITPRGMDVLASHPTRVDNRFLAQYPEFREALARIRRSTSPRPARSGPNGNATAAEAVEEAMQQRQTPSEQLEDAYETIRQNLAEELLQRIKACSSGFFERLVVDLLVKMG